MSKRSSSKEAKQPAKRRKLSQSSNLNSNNIQEESNIVDNALSVSNYILDIILSSKQRYLAILDKLQGSSNDNTKHDEIPQKEKLYLQKMLHSLLWVNVNNTTSAQIMQVVLEWKECAISIPNFKYYLQCLLFYCYAEECCIYSIVSLNKGKFTKINDFSLSEAVKRSAIGNIRAKRERQTMEIVLDVVVATFLSQQPDYCNLVISTFYYIITSLPDVRESKQQQQQQQHHHHQQQQHHGNSNNDDNDTLFNSNSLSFCRIYYSRHDYPFATLLSICSNKSEPIVSKQNRSNINFNNLSSCLPKEVYPSATAIVPLRGNHSEYNNIDLQQSTYEIADIFDFEFAQMAIVEPRKHDETKWIQSFDEQFNLSVNVPIKYRSKIDIVSTELLSSLTKSILLQFSSTDNKTNRRSKEKEDAAIYFLLDFLISDSFFVRWFYIKSLVFYLLSAKRAKQEESTNRLVNALEQHLESILNYSIRFTSIFIDCISAVILFYHISSNIAFGDKELKFFYSINQTDSMNPELWNDEALIHEFFSRNDTSHSYQLIYRLCSLPSPRTDVTDSIIWKLIVFLTIIFNKANCNDPQIKLKAQPYWFLVHFLPPLFQSIADSPIKNTNSVGSSVWKRLLTNDDDYSFLIFGSSASHLTYKQQLLAYSLRSSKKQSTDDVTSFRDVLVPFFELNSNGRQAVVSLMQNCLHDAFIKHFETNTQDSLQKQHVALCKLEMLLFHYMELDIILQKFVNYLLELLLDCIKLNLQADICDNLAPTFSVIRRITIYFMESACVFATQKLMTKFTDWLHDVTTKKEVQKAVASAVQQSLSNILIACNSKYCAPLFVNQNNFKRRTVNNRSDSMVNQQQQSEEDKHCFYARCDALSFLRFSLDSSTTIATEDHIIIKLMATSQLCIRTLLQLMESNNLSIKESSFYIMLLIAQQNAPQQVLCSLIADNNNYRIINTMVNCLHSAMDQIAWYAKELIAAIGAATSSSNIVVFMQQLVLVLFNKLLLVPQADIKADGQVIVETIVYLMQKFESANEKEAKQLLLWLLEQMNVNLYHVDAVVAKHKGDPNIHIIALLQQLFHTKQLTTLPAHSFPTMLVYESLTTISSSSSPSSLLIQQLQLIVSLLSSSVGDNIADYKQLNTILRSVHFSIKQIATSSTDSVMRELAKSALSAHTW